MEGTPNVETPNEPVPVAIILAAVGDALEGEVDTFDRLEVQQGSYGVYGVTVIESYGDEEVRTSVSVG